ncbi:hypothetical protein IW261DRAFT_1569709 [Armillaria novae-zelandiae]|uniref:Uncharacterized protein n=1 Tax=Armillaria novae-zelandiae TaxID=153914 RepID=A0AA39U3L7_9AGAR|nr:hypothetical protein IW261DRAFT_1569709 [Armillaria novae-zelandiae]
MQSYLEHYKAELLKDKELKDSVFKAHTGIEREYHANASKQPIHRILKTITGWIQIEHSQGAKGPPAGAPTGPRRDLKSDEVKGMHAMDSAECMGLGKAISNVTLGSKPKEGLWMESAGL